ncbi:SDR family oxidoreductase [Sodalis ligni]|nr:SDR family oxidoreductase [Sodalis ligni]
MSGYAASKWAAEVLLGQISANYKVPLNIFRCGLLLPHTQVQSDINDVDTLFRLLKSILTVKVALFHSAPPATN